MSKHVVEGAQLQCSMGNAPSALAVPDQTVITIEGKNAATVISFQPNVHLKPFGMCMSMNNPQVAAATSAAMGVLTPQPCIPNVAAPWSPGAAFITIETPQGTTLTDDSTCNCLWGGLIQISVPGQQIVTIDAGSSGSGGSSGGSGAAKGGGGAAAKVVTVVTQEAAAASYLSDSSGDGLGKSDVYSVVVGVLIKDETTATNPLDRDGTAATLSGAAPSGPKLSGGSGQVFFRFEGLAAGRYTIKGSHRVSTGGAVDVEDSRDIDVGPGTAKAGTKQVETVLEMKRRPTVRFRVIDERDGSVVPSASVLSITATPDFVSTIDDSTHEYEVEIGTKYKVVVKPKRGLLYELPLDVTGKAGIQEIEAKLPHRKNVLFVYIDNAEDKIVADDPLGHWPNVNGLKAAASAVDSSLNVKWMLCTAVGATPAELEANHHPLAIFGAGSFWYWNDHIRSPSSMAMLNAWMKMIRDMDVPMLAVCGSHQLVAVAMHGGDFGALAHMDDGGPPKSILDDVASGRPKRIDSIVAAHEEGVFPITTTAAGASDPLASAMGATTNYFAIHHEDMVTNTSGATLIFQESADVASTTRNTPKSRCHVEGLRYELPNRILYTVQFHPEVPTFEDVANKAVNGGVDGGNGSKLVQAWLKLCVGWWKKGPPEL